MNSIFLALRSFFFIIYVKIFSKKSHWLYKVYSFPFIKNIHRITLGNKIYIGPNVHWYARSSSTISIGNNVHFTGDCYISAAESVQIGNNVLIGEFVSIRDADHHFANINIPIAEQGMNAKEIIIEDDVWIGRGSMIAKGVTIGKGSIIGANSFVNTSIPPYSIAVGTPACIIKSRI